MVASGEGVAMNPAGVATFSATMKSSRFMGSDCERYCSEVLRNCAIPLGALRVEEVVLLVVVLAVSVLV